MGYVIRLALRLLVVFILVTSAIAQGVSSTMFRGMSLAARARVLAAGGGPVADWADPNTYTVGLYEMETTNTTVTPDTSGNHRDLTNFVGLSYDPARGPDWIIAGTNQYGRVEHASEFAYNYFMGPNVLSNATSVTLFAWVNIHGNTNDQTYGMVVGEIAVAANKLTGITLGSEHPTVLHAFVTSGSTMTTVNGTHNFPTNEWVFVHMTWKQGSPCTLYTNCVVDGSNSGSSAPLTSKRGLTVGWWQNTALYLGTLDYVGGFVNGAYGFADLATMQTIMAHTCPTNNTRIR